MAERGSACRMGIGKMIFLAMIVVAASMMDPVSVGAAVICGPGNGATSISDAGVTVSFRPTDGKIATGVFFTLDVAVCAADGSAGTLNAVDAIMPAHGHAMNYKPGVSQTAPGIFHVEGLMFHMPGSWQFQFNAEAGGTTVKLTTEQVVE